MTNLRTTAPMLLLCNIYKYLYHHIIWKFSNIIASICRVVSSLICVLLILATCHDIWRTSRGIGFDAATDSTAVTTLHCFSITRNTNKLVSLLNSESQGLSCLNGIRSITTVWLIFIHCVMRMAGLWRSVVMNPKAMDQVQFIIITYNTVRDPK